MSVYQQYDRDSATMANRDPRLDDLIDQGKTRSEQGHPLYGPANRYTGGTLGGQTRNPFLRDAYGAHATWSNPDLQRFQSMLYGDLRPSHGFGGGGGGSFSGGGGGGGFSESGRFTDDIEDVVGGKYLDEGNPYRDKLIDSVSGRIRDEFQENRIPGINSQFEGLGRTGSRAWSRALGDASGEFADSLGQTIGGIEFQDYNARMGDVMNALGMGNQYDMNLNDNRARAAAAASSAGASRYSADRQAELAKLGLLGDAVGLSVGADMDLLGGRRNLAALMSQDQRHALQMTPDLTGMDIRDRGAAIAPLMGLEELDFNRWKTMQDNQNRLQTSRIGTRPQNRAIDFDLWRYEQEQPWMEMQRYMDIINGASGGYGSTRTWGTDTANNSGSGWAGATSGFLGGLGFMQDQKRKNQGGD